MRIIRNGKQVKMSWRSPKKGISKWGWCKGQQTPKVKKYGNWAREAQRKELLQVNFDKSAIGLLLVDAYLGNKAQS